MAKVRTNFSSNGATDVKETKAPKSAQYGPSREEAKVLAERQYNNRQREKERAKSGRENAGRAARKAAGRLASAIDPTLGRAVKGATAAYELAKGVKTLMTNDPSWYAMSKEALDSAASISFNQPLGMPVPMSDIWKLSTPGIYVQNFAPIPGVSKDMLSPVNTGAVSLYSFVRHANSGSRNYEFNDLMIYIQAMDSLYMAFEWGKRIYGLLRQYSQRNWYIARYLIEALNVDFDDFSKHGLDLYNFLVTEVINRLNSLSIPNIFPFVERHRSMCEKVFIEGVDAKSPMLVTTPAYFYKYEGYVREDGGKCTAKFLTEYTAGAPMTYDNYVEMMRDLISGVYADGDTGIMSGDILKAFGEGRCTKLNTFDINYMTPIYADAEMLSQIENSVVFPELILGAPQTTWDMYQLEAGAIICKPAIWLGESTPDKQTKFENLGDERYILMSYSQDPQPAEVMVSTRLMPCAHLEERAAEGDNEEGLYLVFDYAGSEIPVGGYLYAFEYADDAGAIRSLTQSFLEYHTHIELVGAPNVVNATLRDITDCSRFTYLPKRKLVVTNTGVVVGRYMIGDLHNFTSLTVNDLQKMHYTALSSEFAIPMLGMLGG